MSNKTYIWSDLRLNDKSILKHKDRPFKYVETMNSCILDSWKRVVNENDTIINLGNVGFGNKQVLREMIFSLPGRKILVMGDYDRNHSIDWWRDVGFDEVYADSIIYSEYFILSHAPMFLSKDTSFINVHGHEKSYDLRNYLSVMIEEVGFQPLPFSSNCY